MITFHDHAYYRDGTPLTQAQTLAALAPLSAQLKSTVANLAASYKAGAIDAAALQRQLRIAIKDAYIAHYVIGKGGRSNMTKADWGRIGGLVGHQYTYLNKAMLDLNTGSAKQLAQRFGLYISSSTQAFYRGLAAEARINLPAWPGDGTTDCRSNCRCSWELHYENGAVLAYWKLSAAEHCRTCVDRAAIWNPFIAIQES